MCISSRFRSVSVRFHAIKCRLICKFWSDARLRSRQFNSASYRPSECLPCAGLDHALVWRVEGRIVRPVDAGPCPHGEAGIDFLQLGGGVLRLLVVACPGDEPSRLPRGRLMELLHPPRTSVPGPSPRPKDAPFHRDWRFREFGQLRLSGSRCGRSGVRIWRWRCARPPRDRP